MVPCAQPAGRALEQRKDAENTSELRKHLFVSLLPRRRPGAEWSTGATTPADTARRGRTGQLQRREREDRSGSARPGGLGPQCLPDTRTRRRRPPYRPLPRCLAIVLCTDRRGAAVLCDQVSIIHACMHPGHVRSPNTIVRLIRHRRQQACYYALPAPCTQHTRRDSGFITACWRALQLASDSQPVHIRTPMASIEHVAKQILPLLTSHTLAY